MSEAGGTHSEISGGGFFGAVIQARDVGAVSLRLPDQIPAALSGLPPAAAAFCGRGGDLELLLDHLAPGPSGGGIALSSAVVVASVGGMGGVGKTELVVQAARAALGRGWFAGGALFVDMLGYDPDPARRLDAGQALEGFLRAVGTPGEYIPPGVQDRARLFRSLLAAYANEGRRLLVIVDNVSDAEDARPLLPADGVNAAVVTSRHKLADLDARLLNLDALPEQDAVDLLHRALILRDPADRRVAADADRARELAGLCGGLPLALRIIAALLAENPAKPLAVMVADLADATTRLQEMTYAGRSVRAVFDLSFHRLESAEARLFCLLSQNPGPDISTPAAAALAGCSEADARRRLEALARSHLIAPGAGYGRWSMHDLVRLYSDRLGHTYAKPEERDDALSRLLRYYLDTARAAHAHLDPEVTDPAARGFPDREQALMWLDGEYPNLIAAAHTYATSDTHTEIARFLPEAMWYYFDRRRLFNDWISLSEITRNAARRLRDPSGEASALDSLSIALREVGRLEEAIAAGREAVEVCHNAGRQRQKGVILANFGLTLRAGELFEEAVTVCEEGAQICRDFGDRYSETGALENLGISLAAAGRFEQAIAVLQETVGRFREFADQYNEANALDQLGTALHCAYRFQEAINAHRHAARLLRGLSYQHGEARALDNLGHALRDVHQFEEAADAHRSAAKLFHEFGDQHSERIARENAARAERSAHSSPD